MARHVPVIVSSLSQFERMRLISEVGNWWQGTPPALGCQANGEPACADLLISLQAGCSSVLATRRAGQCERNSRPTRAHKDDMSASALARNATGITESHPVFFEGVL